MKHYAISVLLVWGSLAVVIFALAGFATAVCGYFPTPAGTIHYISGTDRIWAGFGAFVLCNLGVVGFHKFLHSQTL